MASSVYHCSAFCVSALVCWSRYTSTAGDVRSCVLLREYGRLLGYAVFTEPYIVISSGLVVYILCWAFYLVRVGQACSLGGDSCET